MRLLQHSIVYRAWQAPFADRKFAPIQAHNDLHAVRRVLDVGCGPGTSTPYFSHADYLGIDLNPDYIADARRRYAREFLVADVTTYTGDPTRRFDFVLVNSLLHHLPTADVRRLLAHLATLVTTDGSIHILDLVLPEHMSVGRLLARLDRGDHPRPLNAWRALFSESFDTVLIEPYPLGVGPVTLWNMVYFKGRPRCKSA
jgi:SAM-dependent methyltransferase